MSELGCGDGRASSAGGVVEDIIFSLVALHESAARSYTLGVPFQVRPAAAQGAGTVGCVRFIRISNRFVARISLLPKSPAIFRF